MLTNIDLDKYQKQATRILRAIDNSRVPISWPAMDEPELVRVIANELVKIARSEKGESDR